MTSIRLKYLHSFLDRFGRVHYYFRYRGNRWPLPGPHEEGFATAYDALLTEIKANPIALKNNIAFMRGSLGWVIERFLVSPAYETRAEATKRNYRRVIDTLKQRYGTGLIKDLQPRHVKKIRNEIREAFTASAADIAISILSTLWDFADEQLSLDLPGADPTFGIKRVHVGHREHEPWPQDLIARFMADASPRLGFAVRLALGTGLRRSDLVKLVARPEGRPFPRLPTENRRACSSWRHCRIACRVGNHAVRCRYDHRWRPWQINHSRKPKPDGEAKASRPGRDRLFHSRTAQERGQ
jgi:hypothetical protein